MTKYDRDVNPGVDFRILAKFIVRQGADLQRYKAQRGWSSSEEKRNSPGYVYNNLINPEKKNITI